MDIKRDITIFLEGITVEQHGHRKGDNNRQSKTTLSETLTTLTTTKTAKVRQVEMRRCSQPIGAASHMSRRSG